MLRRRSVVKGIAASAAAGVLTKSFPRPAIAADAPLKMGVSMPLTGAGFAAVGKLLGGAFKVYLAQNDGMVGGRKIELLIRDDSGNPDNARRIVQEMIVNDKVDVVGVGITPCTLAVAQLVTEAKKATICLSSGASITTTKSPYFARVGFIIAPQAWICAEWAIKNGSKRVVTLVNEWAPGTEAEQAFKTRFTQLGGEVIETLRVPLSSPDFAPPLQRIADLKPDSAFIYFPGPLAPVFTRQFAEKGLGPDRHQDLRAGRSVRRRQPRQCRRSDDRADHVRLLHGGARFAAEQAVSGRLHQAQQYARRLHLARRL